MVLYVDILFAINFSMDFFALFLTSIILRRKIFKERILLSAIFGGMYGVFDIVFLKKTLVSILLSVLVSLLMCLIAFKKHKLGNVVSTVLVFFGVSASLSGIMSVLYNFLNKILSEYIKNYSYNSLYNGARFFVIVSLSMLISMVVLKVWSKEKNVKTVEAEIEFKGIIYNLNGLCDSGNLLREPITGRSVILISDTTDLAKAIDLEPEFKKRYVPFNGVENSGILKGIVPKKILINNIEKSAILAPIKNLTFSGYEMLVPTSLI